MLCVRMAPERIAALEEAKVRLGRELSELLHIASSGGSSTCTSPPTATRSERSLTRRRVASGMDDRRT